MGNEGVVKLLLADSRIDINKANLVDEVHYHSFCVLLTCCVRRHFGKHAQRGMRELFNFCLLTRVFT